MEHLPPPVGYPSGLPDLDRKLRPETGIPPGSLLEIHGPPGEGKTSLALRWVKQHYQERVCAWVATETELSLPTLQWAGVDPQQLLLTRQTADLGGLELAKALIEEGAALVVVDSVSALLGGSLERPLAQLLLPGLFRLKQTAREKGALVILTNQERRDGGVTYVTGSSPGLNRLLDYRIRVWSGEGLYHHGHQIGVRQYFSLVQNGPQFRDWGTLGRYRLYWREGLRNIGEQRDAR